MANVSAPIRVQLSRRKGWRMPPNTVKVSRPSIYGNPFVEVDGIVYANPLAIHFAVPIAKNAADAFELWLAGHLIQAEALKMYRERRMAILTALPKLRSKNVACWCRLDQACHGDVYLTLANS